MGERVPDGRFPVVLKVVHVHVAIAEALAGGNVEVANDLVDAQAAFDAAAFAALLVQTLGVVLALALLDVLATAEGPRGLRVRLADFVARLAASGFDSVRRGVRAIARTTIVGVKVGSRFLDRVAVVYALD